MVLRRIFGLKKNGVTREWRKLYKRCLSIRTPHPIFFLGDKIKNNWMGGAYNTYRSEERHMQGFGGES